MAISYEGAFTYWYEPPALKHHFQVILSEVNLNGLDLLTIRFVLKRVDSGEM